MYIATQQSLSNIIQENLVNGRLPIRVLESLLELANNALISSGDFKSQKLAQVLTENGFEVGDLVKNGFCAKSFWLTLEYFAYESKEKASCAKQLARAFGQLGGMTAFDKVDAKPEPLPLQLPPVRDAVDYYNAIQGLATLTNPILKSLLEQRFSEELGAGNALPGSKQDDLVLCAVLARDLGYKLEKGQDSALCKWVIKRHKPKGKTQHGRYSVNVYSRNEITDTVHAFFR